MARRGWSVTFTVYVRSPLPAVKNCNNLGRYMNQWLFSGNPDYDAGEADYDHIVSLYVVPKVTTGFVLCC